jgi:hypothetical protein
MPSAPTTVAESLQRRLIEAIEEQDQPGFDLLLRVGIAQLGPDLALSICAELPGLVRPICVPTAMQFLHRETWIEASRQLVLAAATQLVGVGLVPGSDVSFSSEADGRPVLHLSRSVYEQISLARPGCLHLVEGYIRLD